MSARPGSRFLPSQAGRAARSSRFRARTLVACLAVAAWAVAIPAAGAAIAQEREAGAPQPQGGAAPPVSSPAPASPAEGSSILLSGRTPEGIWRISGASLSGTVDGPLTIDSVEVQHGAMRLRALRGVWIPQSEMVQLQGAVSIRDSVRTLWAERGFYYRALQQLELEENVRGDGPEGQIFADRLHYDRAQKKLVMNGAVRLMEEGRRIFSSWLNYDLADSSGRAGEPVTIQTDADSVEIRGRIALYDRAAGILTVLGNPQERPTLERDFGELSEKLVVTADTMSMGTEKHEGEARGNVTVTYEGAEAACARAIFLLQSDRILLTGEPSVWDQEGVIEGDSMAVQLREGRADRLVVWGHARSEYQPSAHPAERYFAVGDTLTAYLQGGRVRSVVLDGKAEALYLPPPDARDDGTGLNWTRAARLRIGFGEEGAEGVQFEGQTEGLYVPPSKTASEADGEAKAGPNGAEAGEPPATGGDSAGGALAEGGGSEGGAVESSAGDSPPSRRFDRTRPAVPGDLSADALETIRVSARTGALHPDDALLARLPFDTSEAVRYQGDKIDYRVAGETMTISGNGSVKYQTMELTSSEISLYFARDLVVAKGEPKLSDKDTEVVGDEMTYRIDRGQGLIFQGRSDLETGHYRGERIKRADAQSFFVKEGNFSTCDEESTHFHFRGAKMKIVPGERVVARPVVLYLGHIPVLAIPYAVFPISRGRQSGVLIPDAELGFDTSRGRFLRNVGYYWAPNDYFDSLFWLDYYEEDPRTIYNMKTQYRLRYLLSGNFEASYARQGNELAGRRDRWLLRMGHDQTLGERANLKVSANFQSDKDYAGDRDFGADVDERVNQTLRSQVSLNKSWSFASLSVFADRTENLDDPGNCTQRISQSIPSVNFSLSSFPLGTKPDARGRGGHWSLLSSTYLRSDMRVRSIYSKDWCGETESNQAAGLNVSLSDNRRLFGLLNISPNVAISAAWAHENDEGDENLTGASWSTGVSAGTALYGTFFPNLAGLEGIRHVVELNASYGYRPELRSLDDFPSVGGISLSSSKASSVSLRATQRFHLKWREGEQTKKMENLLVWDTSVSHDFLAEEKTPAGQKPKPWSDFSHSIRLQPGRSLSSDLSITHDPERWRDDYQLSLRTTLRLQGGGGGGSSTSAEVSPVQEGYGGFGDPAAGIHSGPGGGEGLAALAGPWHLTLSHVMSKAAHQSEKSSANLSLGLSATPSWRVEYSIYYDLTGKEVTSQGYSLYRDLHCWQASFERRESGGRSSYYFRISVKELPDLKYERRDL